MEEERAHGLEMDDDDDSDSDDDSDAAADDDDGGYDDELVEVAVWLLVRVVVYFDTHLHEV